MSDPSRSSSPAIDRPSALFVLDPHGRITQWTAQAESIFDWNCQEVQGRLMASLLLPDRMRDLFTSQLEELNESPSDDTPPPTRHREIVGVRKNGEEILLDLSLTRLQLNGCASIVGEAKPLSVQRNLEPYVRRSSVESQLLTQATAFSSAEDSLDNSLQKCLDTLCSTTGWPLGFALLPDRSDRFLCSCNVWHLVPDERMEGLDPENFQIKVAQDEGFIGQIWQTGEPAWTSDLGSTTLQLPLEITERNFRSGFGFPVIADDEVIAVLLFFSWEIMDPNPEMLIVINNFRHQLGRMIERKHWIEERARLAAIVDSSYDAIIGTDLHGRVISWNQGAEQVYGYAADEILGQSIQLILPEGIGANEAPMNKVVTSGKQLTQFESRRRRKDGSIIDVAMTVSPIRDSRGRIVGASTIERNITLSKQREKELRKAKKEAEKANQAKTEFLANISHELRTPMNAILGMLNLSLGEKLPETIRDYLSTAHESAQTLLYLLNDLLDFSRMSAGHLELENEPFRLRETVDTAIKTISLRASEKGLELACHIGKHVPNTLRGDAMRLRQIIINLAGNAIKFTDQGEVLVDVNVQSHRGSQVALQVSVRDTGIGIPPEDQEKIFAPFTQVDASTTRNETGSGLGLSIVRELVAKMGGSIGLESEVGRGSLFYFTVPFEVLPDTSIPPENTELADLPVLVVDDNRTNQVILEETLSNWSMQPDVVGSAKAALKRVQEADKAGRPYSMMIVDALMPEMDGFMLVEELNQRLKDAARPTMILMLSSADRQTFKQRCENLQVAAYLEKPVSQSELMDTLMTVLRGPMLDRESFEQVQPIPQGLNILIAEDTPANQKVIRAILEKRGHHVQIANNGREAVDYVKQAEFDVVLMDVQMPTMDGLQATQMIRQLSDPARAEIPIVAMTAHARREDRRKCLASGMDAYIAKPIDAGKLIQLIESAKHRSTDSSGRHASETWEEIPMIASTKQINIDSAKARMGGNEELVIDLARFFLEDAPKLARDMEQGIANGQAESVERAAHSLKGLAANFDAETLATQCLAVEEHGRNDDLKKAKTPCRDLQKTVRAVCDELKAYIASKE